MQTELQEFSRHWERETDGTLALLRALPTDQYDFRPDTVADQSENSHGTSRKSMRMCR